MDFFGFFLHFFGKREKETQEREREKNLCFLYQSQPTAQLCRRQQYVIKNFLCGLQPQDIFIVKNIDKHEYTLNFRQNVFYDLTITVGPASCLVLVKKKYITNLM